MITKSYQHFSFLLPACLTLFLGVLMTGVCVGAATNNVTVTNKVNFGAASTNSSSAANLLPTEVPVPVAVFDLTAKSTKDPFFPLSLRQPIPIATNASPAFSASVFNLKGLSGSPGHRLALINNRTMAMGEDTEVTTPSGKIKIQCLEIKEASVIIRAESQADLLEVFLRKSVQ